MPALAKQRTVLCLIAMAIAASWLKMGELIAQDAQDIFVSPKATMPLVPETPLRRHSLAFQITVPAADPWTDTGIDIFSGDSLTIAAMPLQNAHSARRQKELMPCNVEGRAKDQFEARDLPLASAPFGALIGKIETAQAAPFLIGHRRQVDAVAVGHLSLGVNTDGEESCKGAFRVTVQISSHEQPTETPENDLIASNVDSIKLLIDRLPRRVTDGAGRAGDLVNFVFIGPEQRIHNLLQEAGWAIVDRTAAQAVVHLALESYSRQDYVEMPMSKLYLFGRTQDFGYAKAEPYKVVASRHHFRLWKVPVEIDGQQVWLGAGTHDIGFNKDQRNGHVTHKIDPLVDLERDYIGDSVAWGKNNAFYLLPYNAIHETHNATGEAITSDGKILVICLYGISAA